MDFRRRRRGPCLIHGRCERCALRWFRHVGWSGGAVSFRGFAAFLFFFTRCLGRLLAAGRASLNHLTLLPGNAPDKSLLKFTSRFSDAG